MAKIYDKNPNLYKESVRCLNQFVKFTVGFKYHFVNSEMLRKYIKSKGCNNMEAFKKVYMEIREKSGACYVSSYCFSDFHPVTRDLRRFRMVLKAHPTGQKFVDFYYAVSPVIVSFCQKNPLFGFFFKALTSPILRVCAYFARLPFC